MSTLFMRGSPLAFPDAGSHPRRAGATDGRTRLVIPTLEAIRRWQGVAVPNAAARRGLAEMAALIAQLEALRGSMTFEEEPSDFDAALRDCRE